MIESNQADIEQCWTMFASMLLSLRLSCRPLILRDLQDGTLRSSFLIQIDRSEFCSSRFCSNALPPRIALPKTLSLRAPISQWKPHSRGISAVVVAMDKSQPQTRPIEEIRLGQRVVARNPDRSEVQAVSDIEPQNWRVVRFEAVEHGARYEIALLRPLEWLNDRNVRIGASIPLALHEIGMHGPGTVVGIDPCPAIEPDDGSGRRVVTATMKHRAANILDLQVEGEDEPIGVTNLHPVWSVDRQTFVPAGDLRPGERLQRVDGTIARVLKVFPRRGPPEFVYNIEVDAEHVYFVTERGVLVHNQSSGKVYHGTDDASAASINGKGLDEDDWIKAAGDAGVDPKGFSVTTDPEIAQVWAETRAAERGGDPVVLEADPAGLPLTPGSPGEWTDPNEWFIYPEDFPDVGPGVFVPK